MPSEKELAANHLLFWPAEKDYRGFVGATEIRNIKGTVIVFHGNAGTADHRAYYVTALGSMGYRVILAEYPGYGARKGDLGEQSFVNDAQVTSSPRIGKIPGTDFSFGGIPGLRRRGGSGQGQVSENRGPPSHYPVGFAFGCGEISVSLVARWSIFERPIRLC